MWCGVVWCGVGWGGVGWRVKCTKYPRYYMYWAIAHMVKRVKDLLAFFLNETFECWDIRMNLDMILSTL